MGNIFGFMSYGIVLGVFGLLLVLSGWMEYLMLEAIEAVPTININAAPEGLNEITGSFIPEGGTPLMSPLGGDPCIFYQIELQELHHTKTAPTGPP